MNGSTSMRRRIGIAAVAVTAMLGALTVSASPASAFTKPPQRYGGYGSGVQTSANLAPALGLANAEVATALSSSNSQGLTSITDELGNTVSSANSNKAAQAFGEALQLNVLNAPVQLVAPARADAPPIGPEVVNELLNVPVAGLASAAVARGRASARFNEDGNVCIIGDDMARGVGEAADVRLLGTTAAPLISTASGANNVASSVSRQLLTAQVRRDGSVAGSKLGVESEVRQHIVPLTVADSTGLVSLKVEVLGDARLRAFAGGLPGTAFVEFGPAPVVRITLPVAGTVGSTVLGLLMPVLGALTPALQGVVGFDPATGVLEIPLGPVLSTLAPVVNLLATLGIVIGEGPRAIGSTAGPTEAADGTFAAAALDLVRIRPAGALSVLAGVVGDVRVGHLEVAAFAPPGGIDCPGIGVAKATDRDPVQVGDSFVYTIAAINPYDCILTNVRVQDDISSTNGIAFSVQATQPPADSVSDLPGGGKRVVFNDIGPIDPRGSKAVQIQVRVDSASSTGRISDTAIVTASCATGGGTGMTNVNLNLSGQVTLNAPQVGQGVGELARTGRDDRLYLFLGLSLVVALAGVEVLRRRSHTQA